MNNSNNRKNFASYILLIIVGVLVFLVGFRLGKIDLENQRQQQADYKLTGDIKGTYQNVDVNILWEVWNKLESTYIKNGLDGQSLIDGAVRGLVESLDDPYTSYLTKTETEDYLQANAGEFEGIGTTLRYTGEYTEIETPIEGYPAQAAGLRPGDVIVEVNGEDMKGQTAYEVADVIKGPAGTEVNLKIARDGANGFLDFTISRQKIDLDSITYENIGDGTVRIKISQFTEDSLQAFYDQWDRIVQQVKVSDPEKVIVDVRNNPGGYVDGVIYVLGEFLPKGTLVMSERDKTGNITERKTNRDGEFQEHKLVVLINEGSASASEIFAGAIQDNNRGEVIGMPTVGKGVEQRIVQLSNGGTLHVVFQQWVLPSGRNISREDPIHPDIEVELTTEDYNAREDPQLNRAKKELD